MEYLQQLSFFGNQNFINVKYQKQSPIVLEYFPKILWNTSVMQS